jgi:hypothetical protein
MPSTPEPKQLRSLTPDRNTIGQPPQYQVRGFPAKAPPGIELSWEYIDRAIALTFKATSIGNRKLYEAKIQQLVRRIQDEKWNPAIALIQFDSDGHLINGFHRIEAIIRTDTRVLCLVVRGLAHDAVFQMDDGKLRNGADSLKFAGINPRKRLDALSAAARAVYCFERKLTSQGSVVFNEEIVRAVRKYPILESFVPEMDRSQFTRSGVVMAALFWIRQIGTSEAENFTYQVLTGADIKVGDVIWLLREKFALHENKMFSSLRRADAVRLIFYAWKLHLSGKTVEYLRLTSSSAPNYPWPDGSPYLREERP